jgi:1-acyl-sn-glycerol-3-phosphate acyltransferase
VIEDVLIKTGKFILACYVNLFMDWNVQNLAEIPSGAKLFAANHPTTTDPFYAGLLSKEPMRIMVTSDAFEVPVFREYLRYCGHICVTRERGKGAEIVAWAVNYLREGKVVAIFPEGALSPEEDDCYGFSNSHTGAARIALNSGAPVIPVGIATTKSGIYYRECVFSKRTVMSRWKIGGPYVVTIGAPLFYEGDSQNWTLVKETEEQLMIEIKRLTRISYERLHAHRIPSTPFLRFRKLLSIMGNM